MTNTDKMLREEWAQWSVPLGDVNGKIADWWLEKNRQAIAEERERMVGDC